MTSLSQLGADLNDKIKDLDLMLNQTLNIQSVNNVLTMKDSIKLDQMNQDIKGLIFEVKSLHEQINKK